MLQSRIIPSLLIRDRGLVKTRQFKDDKYVGDPINAGLTRAAALTETFSNPIEMIFVA